MRWVVVSLLVHAIVLAWFAHGPHASTAEQKPVVWPTLPAFEHVDTVTMIEIVDLPAVAGGGGGAAQARARVATRCAPVRSADAWEQVSVRMEAGSANGDGGEIGNGHGNGNGNGIGFGAGGGIRVATDVPAPPPPPSISKARPAKLVWPNRDEEVDDEANLFVAKVTVDDEGAVVAVHMKTIRVGVKADRAADAIWTFRYAPALDDDGHPVKSTFEQSFQVR
ncbi:MAG TPA: hypothetical protein VL326_20550 [Kofleriaceae bacterium]|nr:hypothetical protein [Kofleriaceae bacterium]